MVLFRKRKVTPLVRSAGGQLVTKKQERAETRSQFRQAEIEERRKQGIRFIKEREDLRRRRRLERVQGKRDFFGRKITPQSTPRVARTRAIPKRIGSKTKKSTRKRTKLSPTRRVTTRPKQIPMRKERVIPARNELSSNELANLRLNDRF